MKRLLTGALIALSLLACPRAAARTDSLDAPFWFGQRAERSVRAFTDEHQTPLLIGLTVATLATQGYLHGAFYNSHRGGGEGVWDIHGAAEVHTALIYATVYVAGLDPVQAAGAGLVGAVLFQGFINLSFGRPFIDHGENRRYMVYGRDLTFKRIFTGEGRYAELVVGSALIASPYIYRAVRKTVRRWTR